MTRSGSHGEIVDSRIRIRSLSDCLDIQNVSCPYNRSNSLRRTIYCAIAIQQPQSRYVNASVVPGSSTPRALRVPEVKSSSVENGEVGLLLSVERKCCGVVLTSESSEAMADEEANREQGGRSVSGNFTLCRESSLPVLTPGKEGDSYYDVWGVPGWVLMNFVGVISEIVLVRCARSSLHCPPEGFNNNLRLVWDRKNLVLRRAIRGRGPAPVVSHDSISVLPHRRGHWQRAGQGSSKILDQLSLRPKTYLLVTARA